MNLKEKHEKAIELIEAIEFYRKRISDRTLAITRYPGQLIGSRSKLTHDIEIYRMVEKRLRQRYFKLVYGGIQDYLNNMDDEDANGIIEIEKLLNNLILKENEQF